MTRDSNAIVSKDKRRRCPAHNQCWAFHESDWLISWIWLIWWLDESCTNTEQNQICEYKVFFFLRLSFSRFFCTTRFDHSWTFWKKVQRWKLWWYSWGSFSKDQHFPYMWIVFLSEVQHPQGTFHSQARCSSPMISRTFSTLLLKRAGTWRLLGGISDALLPSALSTKTKNSVVITL
jgi:hypothetical protein